MTFGGDRSHYSDLVNSSGNTWPFSSRSGTRSNPCKSSSLENPTWRREFVVYQRLPLNFTCQHIVHVTISRFVWCYTELCISDFQSASALSSNNWCPRIAPNTDVINCRNWLVAQLQKACHLLTFYLYHVRGSDITVYCTCTRNRLIGKICVLTIILTSPCNSFRGRVPWRFKEKMHDGLAVLFRSPLANI
jgi:hypothetical protein